jgi:hypothetical protein
MDDGPENASAPDVDVHVEKEEATSDARVSEVGDVPAQDAQRLTSDVLTRLVDGRSGLGAPPMSSLVVLLLDASQRALGADVDVLVGELGDHGFGAEVTILGSVGVGQCHHFLGLGQAMCARSVGPLACVSPALRLSLPALKSALCNPDGLAGAAGACPGRDGFVDE